ncbi:hypothetical protein BX666DRAFT_993687 [Dichotomocladium elegans]|nr:hypothetical protein BX666DRAFT_993687 [Dichotomocladium elegans]
MTRPEKKIINTDEKWCINQGVNLTFEKYAIRFGCTDKQKAYRRYAEIVHHVAEGALKEKLVCDFANWKDSLQQHQFWLDRTLVKQSLKARKEGANVLGTNIRRAAADIKGLGKRKAQGEVDESEDLRRNMLNRAEHDGVFVELLGKSVGTIIKQEALKIYGVWAHGDELTPYGRKNMCLGLSSILDTIDTTENGQRTFFRSHWDTVTKRFSDDYSLKPLALPDTVAETLEIISAVCVNSRLWSVLCFKL